MARAYTSWVSALLLQSFQFAENPTSSNTYLCVIMDGISYVACRFQHPLPVGFTEAPYMASCCVCIWSVVQERKKEGKRLA